MVGLSKNYLFKVGEKEAELCHQRQHVCPGLTVEYWYTFNMFKCLPHQDPYEYLYTSDFCIMFIHGINNKIFYLSIQIL